MPVCEEKPKYQIVLDWLLERIQSGAYQEGQQIPTENELSQQFSVSRQTVRQAISKLEADGRVERTRGSGTFVRNYAKPSLSDAAVSRKNHRIGVITTYLDDYVFPSIINGIEQTLAVHEYVVILGITYNKPSLERRALEKFRATGVDGIIIEGTQSALPTPNAALLDEFRKANIPMVFINGTYQDASDSYVIMDDILSGQLLTQFLAKKGHRHIGGIFKSDDIQGVKRYEGVMHGAQQNHLDFQEEATFWYTTEDLPDMFSEVFDPIFARRMQNVSAMICYNDEIAVKLIARLRRLGKNIPEDYSIVSFDNSSLADPNVFDLTSITYPAFDIGKTAAQILLRCLENPQNIEKIKFTPQLIERNSSAALQSSK